MIGVHPGKDFMSSIQRDIAKAKAKGVYANRKRTKKVSDNRIFALKADGLNNTEISRYLSISRMTVYRSLKRLDLV